ncbi:uncharacterized protein LOC143183628 [Calliopsis andreniformis]|uniref:uncharacterized protein LOC143183628 n=1 Tax=Calliopsis andreniformis TaxID=337506 RepID=UPI003FCD6312
MEEDITIRVEEKLLKPERTLRPIMYVSWLLSVGVARPVKCSKAITVILHLIHFGLCSTIVAYSIMDFDNFRRVFPSELFEIMYAVNESVCHISSFYYVFHIIQHYDKWPELMKKMESLDQRISKELPINDNCMKIRQILAILIICVLGPMSAIAHVLYYYFIVPNEIYFSDLLFYYRTTQTLANSFVFDIVVYMVCNRFRTINEMIKQLDETLGAYWAALKIRTIRNLHNEACSVVTTLNEIYGLDLLLCSTNSFIMVVMKLFRIYMSAVEHEIGYIFLNNMIWTIYGGQFIVMCWVCTMTLREIAKTGPYIDDFVLNTQHTKFSKMASFRADENTMNLNNFGLESLLRTNFERDCVRNEVNDFSLQLQQHPVKFTACDFFEVNNSLLTRFISVITTYLIILVQFYKPKTFLESKIIDFNDHEQNITQHWINRN